MPRGPRLRDGALVRGCGQAYALQTVEPVKVITGRAPGVQEAISLFSAVRVF